jgi:hypothetical protein
LVKVYGQRFESLAELLCEEDPGDGFTAVITDFTQAASQWEYLEEIKFIFDPIRLSYAQCKNAATRIFRIFKDVCGINCKLKRIGLEWRYGLIEW